MHTNNNPFETYTLKAGNFGERWSNTISHYFTI